MEGKYSLIRELTYTKVGEDATWNLTMAQPEFIARKNDGNCKFQPTGVYDSGLVVRYNNNLILGGSLQYRKMPPNPMLGSTAMTDTSVMAKFQHDDFLSFAHEQPTKPKEFSDGNKSMTAKASTSVGVNFSGVKAKDITVEHHVK